MSEKYIIYAMDQDVKVAEIEVEGTGAKFGYRNEKGEFIEQQLGTLKAEIHYTDDPKDDCEACND